MRVSFYILKFFSIRITTLVATIYLLAHLQNTLAQAQITPAANDTNTTVSHPPTYDPMRDIMGLPHPDNNTFNITGGIKTGENLFHSFDKFGLQQGQTANFISNPSIQNILTRITGGEASFINGLIKVTAGNSNLYFMNPAGIMFGNNARLDVPAAFTATTANGIGFGDKWFNAIGSNDYKSLVGNPTQLAFTMNQPGAIVNNAYLYSNGNISLIGGTVLSNGEISSREGEIAIASVPGNRVVRFSQPGQILNLEVQPLLAKESSPINWNLPILSLPQLLTGGNIGNASNIKVDGDKVILTGSGIQIQNGDVVTNYVNAKNVAISANRSNILLTPTPLFYPIIRGVALPKTPTPGIGSSTQEITAFPVQANPVESIPDIPTIPLTPPAQKENNERLAAKQLFEQGVNFYRQNKFVEAHHTLQTSLKLYQETNNAPGVAITLNSLGGVSLYLHDYKQATEYSQKLLLLARKQNNPQAQAQALVNLGIADKALGRYNQALSNYQQALSLARQIKSQLIEMQVLGNLGNVYEALGDYDNAIISYEKSINLAHQLKIEAAEAITLGNLGSVYANLSNYDKAIANYQKSLQISKKLNENSIQASTLINLGSIYHSQNQIENARTSYQQALELSKITNDKKRESEALANLGIVYQDLREYLKAIQYQEQNLAIAQKINDPAMLALSLSNLGNTLFRANKLDDAEQKVRAAIKIYDNLRPGLNDTYKVSIFDTQASSYSLLQEILIATNKPEAALEASEKGRARAFSELLAQRIYDKDNKQAKPTFPNIDKIRQTAREQNATLVEYSIIGDDNFKARGKQKGREQDLFIWVVTPTGKVTFRRIDLKKLWNKNATLTDVISINRCLIFNPFAECGKLTEAIRGIKNQQISAPTKSLKSQDYRQILHQILIEPISELLPSNPDDNVIFIPHGSLFLVPFPALQDKQGKYLIEKHAIRTAPSIQILDLTQALKAKREQKEKNSTIFISNSSKSSALVVGNPIMPKVYLKPGQNPEQLSELPEAEREALDVAKILNTNPVVRNNATKAYILNKMPSARFIHLATHGLLEYGTSNGQVSLQGLGIPGAIALAPSNTSDGNDDGLLTANEIINLRLNAELVVLSACSTGEGRISGDGVIGLSRSFISAGVESLVVSLWAVRDTETAKLMKYFYQALQKNPNKASALRQAMLMTMKEEPQPLYWAAFTLIGES
jgi:filamentous hemagglutinin family protein